PAQGHRPQRTPQSLRLSHSRLRRLRLHRMRHLFPRVSRTRRTRRLSHFAQAPRRARPSSPGRHSMRKQLMKGNDALMKSAILAGCRAFYGYPITPASEIAEAAALHLPRAGGVFLQAESEVAAINMLY